MPGSSDLPRIVQAQLPFVYACALRQLNGNVHLAEDVTQAVFIILARNLPRLRIDAGLRDWLFVTTRYAAKNAMKTEARRKYHERHAAVQRPEHTDPCADHDLTPVLDEAIARLNRIDRAGVMLSFFDNLTFRQVGAALGVSEEAARKRVSRAVQKLRVFFRKRGIAINAEGITRSIRSQASAPVPSTLAGSVTAAALAAAAGKITGGASASFTIAKGVNHMIALMKIKLAAACVAGCLLVGAGGVAIVSIARAEHSEAPPFGAAAGVIADIGRAKFDDGVTVEIAGLCKNAADEAWWRADGSVTEKACDPSTSNDTPALTHAICLRVSGVPEDAGVDWVMPANNWSSQPATLNGAAMEHAQIMTFTPNQKAIDVNCHVATGAWQNVFESQGADNAKCGGGADDSSFAIAPAGARDGKTLVNVSYVAPNRQLRVIALDAHGVEHPGNCVFSGATKSFTMITMSFDFPIADFDRTVIQTRPYDHVVQFRNVTMDPAKKTKTETIATKS